MSTLTDPIPSRTVGPAPGAFARARAFTLLELVLALTLLASMTVLIASMWSQARRWGDDNAGDLHAMRLPRVLALVRQQWSDRRTSAPLEASGLTVSARHDRLSFVTATPVLFPGWPLVRATYLIEPDEQRDPRTDAPLQRLVYIEEQVGDVGAYDRFQRERRDAAQRTEGDAPAPPRRPGDRDARALGEPGVPGERGDGLPPPPGAEQIARSTPRRLVVLERCAALRFERYGLTMLEPAAPARPGSSSAPGQPAESQIIDARAVWRAFEPDFDPALAQLLAIRLLGTIENQEFACVFVVGASP